METTDIDSLILQLNNVKSAMAHPDFEAAYEELLSVNKDNAPFRFKDVNDTTILVWLVDDNGCWIWEENGKLFSQGSSDPCVWKDGEWVDTADLDDEDDE